MSQNQNTPVHAEIVDEDEGREVTTGALVAINSAEINQQIMTAKAYPRDVTTFRKNVLAAATLDETVAKSCMYALKRREAGGGDKIIEGPSARFAEIVGQTWGNCRYGARVTEVGETHVTAQGFFYDLENNVAVSFEVMRPIVGKKTPEHPNGKRFSNDMIGVTGNAACSIALRNAVFKGVPKAFWNYGYLAARQVVAGDMATIGERRTKMLKAFKDDFGVAPEQVYALIGIKGAPDITLDHMVFLGGLHNAIKEGETTVAKAFDPENFSSGPGGGVMTPARPERSEFSRDETGGGAKDDQKTEAPKEDPKPAETAKVAEPEKPAAEPVAETVVDEAKAARDAEYEDWFKDALKEMKAQPGIRQLTDFYDNNINNVVGAEKIKEFDAVRDARQKEILESTRKSRK